MESTLNNLSKERFVETIRQLTETPGGPENQVDCYTDRKSVARALRSEPLLLPTAHHSLQQKFQVLLSTNLPGLQTLGHGASASCDSLLPPTLVLLWIEEI